MIIFLRINAFLDSSSIKYSSSYVSSKWISTSSSEPKLMLLTMKFSCKRQGQSDGQGLCNRKIEKCTFIRKYIHENKLQIQLISQPVPGPQNFSSGLQFRFLVIASFSLLLSIRYVLLDTAVIFSKHRENPLIYEQYRFASFLMILEDNYTKPK